VRTFLAEEHLPGYKRLTPFVRISATRSLSALRLPIDQSSLSGLTKAFPHFKLGYYWRLILIVEKVYYSRYNKKSVQDRNIKKKILIDVAFLLCFMYNRQCWSLTAMMWKVADTPGRFAMASV
jgi:hypothetical protein